MGDHPSWDFISQLIGLGIEELLCMNGCVADRPALSQNTLVTHPVHLDPAFGWRHFWSVRFPQTLGRRSRTSCRTFHPQASNVCKGLFKTIVCIQWKLLPHTELGHHKEATAGTKDQISLKTQNIQTINVFILVLFLCHKSLCSIITTIKKSSV